jgi:cytochrome c-type biogenesis protein CcmH/NrfF
VGILVGVAVLVAGWLIWRRAKRRAENKNAARKDPALREEETRLID